MLRIVLGLVATINARGGCVRVTPYGGRVELIYGDMVVVADYGECIGLLRAMLRELD